jgi:hypothetical protein
VYTQVGLHPVPVSAKISDVTARVSNVTFFDNALDAGDVGGVLSWAEPEDISQVTHYVVYFSEVDVDSYMTSLFPPPKPVIDRSNLTDCVLRKIEANESSNATNRSALFQNFVFEGV